MKHIHRFFVSEPLSSGKAVCLEGGDSFHASRVLRLKPGSRIELAAPDGSVYEGVVARVDGSRGGATVEATVGAAIEPGEGTVADDEREGGGREALELTVAQALPKGKKFDLIVEKLSELGVSRLVPVYSEKSVARNVRESTGKVERWRRVARAAAGQSRRGRVMVVDLPVELAEWLGSHEGAVIALATEKGSVPLSEALGRALPGKEAVRGSAPPGRNGRPGLALVVGPEAGFSAGEVAALEARGAVLASLGVRVLRTETAALVAAAISMHRLGELG